MTGNFEVHLTAAARQRRRAATVAAADGLKFSDIVLDRGRHPSQPMITFGLTGDWPAVAAAAHAGLARLRDAGIEVVRMKVEADPRNPGVPVTDADGAADGLYFEHHLKLRLPDAAAERLAAITELVTPHGARLSRNARRQDAGGEQRFVTQRCHRAGRATARRRLAALRAALAGHEVIEVEEEYVVLDSALQLDDGWLGEPGDLRTAPAPR